MCVQDQITWDIDKDVVLLYAVKKEKISLFIELLSVKSKGIPYEKVK